MVEASELELIKIKYNFLNEHCYHKNGNYALPYIAVLEYIDNLPVLFLINLFNILNDDIFLHTFCQTLFIVLNSKKAVRIQQISYIIP